MDSNNATIADAFLMIFKIIDSHLKFVKQDRLFLVMHTFFLLLRLRFQPMPAH